MWKCPKCGRTFQRENQQHYCGRSPETIDEYISEQSDEIRPILNTEEDILQLLQKDIRILEKFYQGDGYSCIYAAGENEMIYLGIDIGTTTIGFLLVDGSSGREIEKKVLANSFWIQGKDCEKLQDADGIADAVLKECSILEHQYSISGIGISTQMHGIVYLNQDGMALSPLITWQDGRGGEKYCSPEGIEQYKAQGIETDGRSYAQVLSEMSGSHLSTGYGSVTLFFDTMNRQVPQGASQIAAIGDYAAMRLCGLKRPLMHGSKAASIGMFGIGIAGKVRDAAAPDFDADSIRKAGMNPDLFPEVSTEEVIIGQHNDIPVACAIGDNQASFLGTVGEESGSHTLINIGTGSQISCAVPEYVEVPGLECRPYVDGKYLLVGSSLCGGRAYAVLEQFFRDICGLCGQSAPGDLMRRMDEAAEKYAEEAGSAEAVGATEKLTVDTRLSGTREIPSATGCITGIRTDNFTPGSVAYAFLEGISRELFDFYQRVPKKYQTDSILTCSGNGIRNSRIQQKIIQEMFGMKLRIPEHAEEAAYGAAVCVKKILEGKTIPASRFRC